jgi:hypothetical protein
MPLKVANSNTVGSQSNVHPNIMYSIFGPNYNKATVIYPRYNVQVGRPQWGTLLWELTVI